MAAINWAFLCDYAFVDAAQKWSIIGNFGSMHFSKLPSKWQQMFVAMQMVLEPGESVKLGVKITAPSGNIVSQIGPQNIASPPNTPPNSAGFVTLAFYNPEFTETGEHAIEIVFEDTTVHSIPLQVNLRKK